MKPSVLLILFLAQFFVAGTSATVVPQERLYFSWPIGPPVDNNQQQQVPPKQQDSTEQKKDEQKQGDQNQDNQNQEDKEEKDPQKEPQTKPEQDSNPSGKRPSLVQAIGQALGNFLTNLFGGAPQGSQVKVMPLGQAVVPALQPGGKLNIMPFGKVLGIMLKSMFA